jgi:hypothetical protein
MKNQADMIEADNSAQGLGNTGDQRVEVGRPAILRDSARTAS